MNTHTFIVHNPRRAYILATDCLEVHPNDGVHIIGVTARQMSSQAALNKQVCIYRTSSLPKDGEPGCYMTKK